MPNKIILTSTFILFAGGITLVYLWFTRPIVPPYQTKNHKQSEISNLEKSLSTGSPSHCVIEEPKAQTTLIIKGKKSFTKTVNKNSDTGEKTVTVYTINDGEHIYSWDSASPGGILISLTENSANISPPTGNKTELSLPKSNDYGIRCLTAPIEESVFNPPPGIEFKSIKPRNPYSL